MNPNSRLSIADSCMPFYEMTQVTEKKISELFRNSAEESELFKFKKDLKDNNGRFSAGKIAEVCSKVLGATQPDYDGGLGPFAIKYQMDDLKYMKDSMEVSIAPDIFIKIFKEVTNIDLKIGENKNFIEGVVDCETFLQQSKLLMRQVEEKEIRELFDNAPEDSLLGKFEVKLANNNGRFSAEKIAELCTEVLGSTKPVFGGEDASFKIKYKIDKLEYIKQNMLVNVGVVVFIEIFKKITNIDLKIREDKTIEGIMDQNTYLLQSKLKFKAPSLKNDLLPSHFLELYKNKHLVDVKLAVGNTIIDAHKSVLAQCPFFEKIFLEEWKDSKENPPIALNDYSCAAVTALIHFLYCHQLETQEEASIPFYLEMLKLVGFVQYDLLKPILIEKIFNCVNKNNFIHLATAEFEDPSLAHLFQLYLAKHFNDTEIDLTPWPFQSLLMLSIKAKEYGISGKLIQNAIKAGASKMELNSDFILLCKEILRVQDADAKNALIGALKENKELYARLQKDEECKEHKKAFNTILKDISL
jgi:hypothetical protein